MIDVSSCEILLCVSIYAFRCSGTRYQHHRASIVAKKNCVVSWKDKDLDLPTHVDIS